MRPSPANKFCDPALFSTDFTTPHCLLLLAATQPPVFDCSDAKVIRQFAECPNDLSAPGVRADGIVRILNLR
ncbi:hypothetical protein [Bradyrhizobium paxllaeri]|uniref:hypothetical protein n=1 Tax=Bradyrhizobium paxllaeri TaxID=190148 RepID=UPI000810E709|nr:hypothetical protein [Bradyrhizobium paxllaeri]